MIQSSLDDLIIWGHGLSAFGFMLLAAYLVHRQRLAGEARAVHYALIGSLFFSSLWSASFVATPFGSAYAEIAETLRNGGWLTFMFLLLWNNRLPGASKAAGYVYSSLFMLLAVQLILAVAAPYDPVFLPQSPRDLLLLNWVLRMLFAIGALMLVHDLYSNSDNEARWGISLPLSALTAMWFYDLNFYTIAYLTREASVDLLAARGFAMAALVPVIALGTRRNAEWNIRMSRRVAFHSASVLLVGVYLLLMMMAMTLIEMVGGDYARLAQVALAFLMSVLALLIIPTGKFKATLKVHLAKHFYQHRYDYRDEWMRFTDTIGRADQNSGPVEQRVIKAIGDITESPSGLLFMRDNLGSFRLAARWNWVSENAALPEFDQAAIARFIAEGFIVDLDDVRDGIGPSSQIGGLPFWLLEEKRAWVLMPLVHIGELVGLTVLDRPQVPRRLDWEDLDMLRVAGAQAASYLAEARGREQLIEAQRFDEFNRRFAFIMHDIKNLVSQLSLLARNAERHADNPEFRADMVETLQSSVGKMNEMLARLSQHHKKKAAPPEMLPMLPVLEQILAEKKRHHPLLLEADATVFAHADSARVNTILGHLIQNAIDASAHDSPVTLRLEESGPWAAISIIDQGTGISEEFLRERLFKPFSSSKDGGFGIGAYEAQMLAQQMGGRIEVLSALGEGSRFTLYLPICEQTNMKQHLQIPALKEEAA